MDYTDLRVWHIFSSITKTVSTDCLHASNVSAAKMVDYKLSMEQRLGI